MPDTVGVNRPPLISMVFLACLAISITPVAGAADANAGSAWLKIDNALMFKLLMLNFTEGR